jgi:MSHA pilin protein MshD
MTRITHAARTSPRRAFTLVEAAVSCIIIAVMLSAALATSGAARAREQKAIDRQRGLFLAQSLMSEILDKVYVDPGALPLFGPEAAEVGHARSTFNDVDDFDHLNDSPPKDSAGAAILGYTRWARTVSVQWVTPGNLNTASLTETNLKKITVTVTKNGVPVVELNALRSKARDSL